MSYNVFKPVQTKISKTVQTRGADDDVIYQNRVKRNNTVLIPYSEYEQCKKAPTQKGEYENGYIVLIKPDDYFKKGAEVELKKKGLKLGYNMLVFYETREQYKNYPIKKSWKPATSRVSPLGGEYVARIPATTEQGQEKIIAGFNTSKLKGAGIRVYEYADDKTVKACKLQLEFLFWSCYDIEDFLKECSKEEAEKLLKRMQKVKKDAKKQGLADVKKLQEVRIINNKMQTICPLCLKPISALEFASKMVQAKGREVPDLTVTNISLFHIHELRSGEFNHRAYNLGWGHHHCNVTVADKGVQGTLEWMKEVLKANDWI
jgi:hypothetical protein